MWYQCFRQCRTEFPACLLGKAAAHSAQLILIYILNIKPIDKYFLFNFEYQMVLFVWFSVSGFSKRKNEEEEEKKSFGFLINRGTFERKIPNKR